MIYKGKELQTTNYKQYIIIQNYQEINEPCLKIFLIGSNLPSNR